MYLIGGEREGGIGVKGDWGCQVMGGGGGDELI